MSQICASLRSSKLAGRETAALAREYALLALRDVNEISLETELDLVGQVTSDCISGDAPKPGEWAARRAVDARARLHAWRRMENAIDRNWDPNEFWSLVPPRPPASVPWVTGNPPDAIKDPVIRAEYEEALKEYSQKVDYHNRQRQLRKVHKRFVAQASEYTVQAYSLPPFDLNQLKGFLEEHSINTGAARGMLDAVKKANDKAGQAKTVIP